MKIIKYVFITLISIYLISLLIDIFISKSFLKSSLFEGELGVWNDIYDGNVSEDLIVYGSSRTYVQINPEILDKELNINSYNLGFNGQKIDLIKYRNDVLLKNKIHPKNVIINLDIVGLTSGDIFNEEQFIPVLLYDKKLFKMVEKSLDLNFLDLYIPLLRYRKFKYRDIDMMKELYKIYFYSNYKHQNFRKKGFRGIDYPWSNLKKEISEIKIDSSKLRDLERMIIDLKEVNTNVILINSPEYISQIKNQKNRNDIIGIYNNISKKHKIPFIDYTNDSINFKKELFYNPNHLNSSGADIFSQKLAKDLIPYLKK